MTEATLGKNGITEHRLSETIAPEPEFWKTTVEECMSSVTRRFSATVHGAALSDSVRRALADELKHMENAMRVLRRGINDHVLAALLPWELLVHIFESLVPMWPIDLRQPAANRALGWVSVCHVCTRWRDIALQHKPLWTSLYADGSTPWSVFLERAGPCALMTVQASCSNTRPPTSSAPQQVQTDLRRIVPKDGGLRQTYHDLIVENIHRISVLELENAPDALIALLSRLKAIKPRLEELSLTATGQPGSTSLFYLNHPFLRAAPRLRHIHLDSVSFPWSNIDLPELTVLHLCRSVAHVKISPIDILSDLLSSLRYIPRLEELHLHDVIMDVVEIRCPSTGPVALPHLRELSISDQTADIFALWGGITVPARCTVHIQYTPEPDTPMADLSGIPRAFGAHLAGPAATAYKHLFISDQHPYRFYRTDMRPNRARNFEFTLSTAVIKAPRPLVLATSPHSVVEERHNQPSVVTTFSFRVEPPIMFDSTVLAHAWLDAAGLGDTIGNANLRGALCGRIASALADLGGVRHLALNNADEARAFLPALRASSPTATLFPLLERLLIANVPAEDFCSGNIEDPTMSKKSSLAPSRGLRAELLDLMSARKRLSLDAAIPELVIVVHQKMPHNQTTTVELTWRDLDPNSALLPL